MDNFDDLYPSMIKELKSIEDDFECLKEEVFFRASYWTIGWIEYAGKYRICYQRDFIDNEMKPLADAGKDIVSGCALIVVNLIANMHKRVIETTHKLDKKDKGVDL